MGSIAPKVICHELNSVDAGQEPGEGKVPECYACVFNTKLRYTTVRINQPLHALRLLLIACLAFIQN